MDVLLLGMLLFTLVILTLVGFLLVARARLVASGNVKTNISILVNWCTR